MVRSHHIFLGKVLFDKELAFFWNQVLTKVMLVQIFVKNNVLPIDIPTSTYSSSVLLCWSLHKTLYTQCFRHLSALTVALSPDHRWHSHGNVCATCKLTFSSLSSYLSHQAFIIHYISVGNVCVAKHKILCSHIFCSQCFQMQ
jgi:hypothetical protein